MARLDTRPKTTSMTPKVVNISPMGSRRSSFIVESPEDHVEHRGERQHHHTKCGRALVPSGFVVRDAGGERIHQPLEVLVRLVAPREIRDHDGANEARAPGENRGPEV